MVAPPAELDIDRIPGLIRPPGAPGVLIVLTAAFVVLGTLVLQGLTLKPLLRALRLDEDDPIARELSAARARATLSLT